MMILKTYQKIHLMKGASGDMKEIENNKDSKIEADGDHRVNDTDEVMEIFGTYVMSRIKSMQPRTRN